MGIIFNSHKEKIECPECGHVQEAEVKHTFPFATYIHECVKCDFFIMESEWKKVNYDEKTNSIN
jgi:Zn ribbon nucleic-acid-binding protein